MRANDALRERQRRNIVTTPRNHAVVLGTPSGARNGNSVRLADVLERWSAERKPRTKTASEWRAIVRKFAELHAGYLCETSRSGRKRYRRDAGLHARKSPTSV